MLTKHLNLRDDERVAAIVRRSLLVSAGPLLAAAASIFLAFFLIVPLFARGNFGMGIFTFLIALGVLTALRAVRLWYGTAFVVTSARVIDLDQRGFFHRQLSEARFEKIEDISVVIHGIFATLFHLGTIRVLANGGQALIEIRAVPRPEIIQELLGRLQEETQAKRAPAVAGIPAVPEIAQLSEVQLADLRGRMDVEIRLRHDRRTKDSAP
mgnify:CR=1 FL=1